MISAHLRERLYQRYGIEATVEVIRELRRLAAATPGQPDQVYPGRERVTVSYQGQSIRLVWNRQSRMIITFLPAPLRLAWCAPKKKKGKR